MRLQRLAAIMRWAVSYIVTAPIGVGAGLVYLTRTRVEDRRPLDHEANVFTLEACGLISACGVALAIFWR